MNSASGMMVHVASRRVDPSTCVATGLFSLRYRIEKPKTSAPTRTRPITVIARRKKKKIESVSVGRNGRCLARKKRRSVEPLHQKLPQDWTYMHRYPLSILFLGQVVIAPELVISSEHEEHEAAQTCDRNNPAQRHHAHDDQ